MPSIVHGPQTAVGEIPSADHSKAECRPQSTVGGMPSTDHSKAETRPRSTVHRPQLGKCRPQSIVHRPQQGRNPSAVDSPRSTARQNAVHGREAAEEMRLRIKDKTKGARNEGKMIIIARSDSLFSDESRLM